MRLLVAGLWVVAPFLGSVAHAAVLDFKPVAIESRPQDTLIIRGYEGDVKLVPGRGSQVVVKVRQETSDTAPAVVRESLDEWNFSLQRGEGGVEVVVQSPGGRDVWRQILMTGGMPKFHLEITAPALPVQMSWRSGKVFVDGWMAPLRLNVQEGLAQVTGGTGDIRVIGQELEIRVKNRTGRVMAETYSGKVNLEAIKGNADIENFNGDTQVSQIEGQLNFRSYRSPLLVSNGKGRVEFETVRGPIKLVNFGGDLKGSSDEAAINARLSNANEVRVTTQSGGVNLELPNSSASVSAASVEGPISGPSHIKVEQLTGQRILRGRLKGGIEGSVVVRTQSGPIKIR